MGQWTPNIGNIPVACAFYVNNMKLLYMPQDVSTHSASRTALHTVKYTMDFEYKWEKIVQSFLATVRYETTDVGQEINDL